MCNKTDAIMRNPPFAMIYNKVHSVKTIDLTLNLAGGTIDNAVGFWLLKASTR